MVFSSLRRHSGRAGSTSGMGNYTAHYVDLPVGMRKGKSWQERLIPESRIARAAVLLAIAQGLIALALEIVITVFHLQQHDNANFTHRVGMNGMDDGGITMMRRMNLSISVLVYHYIFMCAQLFYVTMTWDAVLRKNTLQMIGISIFSFVTIAYTYIQSNQHAKMNMNDIEHLAMVHSVFVHNTVPYEMTLIGVVAVGSVAMSALTWELYQEFGWKIYKKLGADLQIIRK